MKTLCLFLIAALVSFSLVSCGSTPGPVDEHVSENAYSVSADWVMFDTLSGINDSADCMIVAKVLSKGSPLSVGYSASEFQNFSSLIETNPALASKMSLSIRTPYAIEVKEVISSDVALSVGDTIDLYQIGGTFGGITLTDRSTTPLDVGAEYVLILDKHVISDSVTYYCMITPIQGYAEIVEASTDARNKTITYKTHEENHLFDSISSIADIYDAIEND